MAELARRRGDGEPIIVVDVRGRSYDESERKIAGAVRVPVSDLVERCDSWSREETVVTYCTCSREHTSAHAARLLVDEGFRALALRGGFNAWVDAGEATEPKAG